MIGESSFGAKQISGRLTGSAAPELEEILRYEQDPHLYRGGIGAIALLAAGTLPASAVTSGDTTTTFTLDAGTIDIFVQANAALGNGMSGQPTVSGSLGGVSVYDNRGGTAGWTVTAASTQFFRSGGTTTVSDSATYNSGSVNKTGDVTVAGSGGEVLVTSGAAAVVTGSAVTGNNSASWNPTLTVALPPNSLAGSYSGTVTTSVT